jgi:hypothetical protein
MRHAKVASRTVEAGPSAEQLVALQKLFLTRKRGLTAQQFQQLLSNGHLIKALIAHIDELGEVDRSAFESVLDGNGAFSGKPIPWTSPKQYMERIEARAVLRGWPQFHGASVSSFDRKDYKLQEELRYASHGGPFDLRPLGMEIWLGGTLEHNLTEALAWLSDEVEGLGGRIRVDFDASTARFRPGCEIEDVDPFMHPTNLDLVAHWDPKHQARLRNLSGSRQPGLELVWLLALNPQVLLAINGQSVPYMIAPGVTVADGHGSRGELYFMGRNDDGSCMVINSSSMFTGFSNTSLVTFTGKL